MARDGFAGFTDDLFKAGLIGVAAWGVSSLSELNKNVAVIVQQVQIHDKLIDKHSAEIEEIRYNYPRIKESK